MDGIDRSTIDIRKHQDIGTRESQLWWLAVLIIGLLALALFVIDMTNRTDKWWFSPQLEFALNTRLMRLGLVIAILLICAYFRDSVRKLRRENDTLVWNLADYGKQLEKKNCEVSRLKDLSDELISLADLPGALDLVLGMAVEVIGADTASVMLREKGSDALKIVASRGLPEDIAQSARVRVGESIAGLVAAQGRAIILNSDELTGEVAKRALRRDTIVSSVIVPIQLGEEVRGVVNVAKLRGGACFTEEDMSVLSTLANQAALAIQKIELLDDLRSQVCMLAATVEELKHARAELIQSEKLASIGQLAGGVAHEINNPLQVILGRAEMLLAQETDEDRIGYLNGLLEHTNRIADIVSNLLSFSRQNSDTEFRDVNINAVLNKTLGLLEPQMTPDDISVAREFEDGIDTVVASPMQLQQVFTNLALNAYQAMLSEGRPGTLTVRTKTSNDAVQIEFQDTGPGIPQEHVARLFEPFFTTKAEGEGTGLGLSITYGIVQSHGGTLQVRSDPGQGACFIISLPVKKDLPNDGGEVQESP